MKRLPSQEQRARRLRSAGPALVLALTAAIIAFAWPTSNASVTPVDFNLNDTVVLAESQSRTVHTSAAPTLASIRDRLERFTRSGDARQLRFASAELAEWRSSSEATAESLLLGARIQQSRHNFAQAADTLEQALELRGDATEAWLLYADVQRRAGNIRGSRRACMQLALASDATLAQYCALQVTLISGETERALGMSRSLLESQQRIDDEIRPWTMALAADAAFAAGDTHTATSLYRELVSSDDSSLASRLSLADILLESRQAEDALAVVSGDGHLAAAQVRIAAAADQLKAGIDPAIMKRLDALHSAAIPADADPLLLRDRALLELNVRGNAKAAVDFALANWAEQKGLHDLRLLRRAAMAADDSDVLSNLERWQRQVREGRI